MLTSESARITLGIGRTLLSTYSGEPSEDWCSFADSIKELGLAVPKPA
jgi:hypothetical protein